MFSLSQKKRDRIIRDLMFGIAFIIVGLYSISADFSLVFYPISTVILTTSIWIMVTKKIDPLEKEPPLFTLSAFIWGSFISALLALVLNNAAVDFMKQSGVSAHSIDEILAFYVAPFFEEIAKFTFFIVYFRVLRKQVDGIIDWIFYSFMLGLGFAAIENLSYFTYGCERGKLIEFVILRGGITPFLHPILCLISSFGVFLCLKKPNMKKLHKYGVILLFLFLGIATHSYWNHSSYNGWFSFWVGFIIINTPTIILIILAFSYENIAGRKIFRNNLWELPMEERDYLCSTTKKMLNWTKHLFTFRLIKLFLLTEYHNVASLLAFEREAGFIKAKHIEKDKERTIQLYNLLRRWK